MEDLQRLLHNTVSQYTILRDTLQEVRANNDVRAQRNVIFRLFELNRCITGTMQNTFLSLQKLGQHCFVDQNTKISNEAGRFRKRGVNLLAVQNDSFSYLVSELSDRDMVSKTHFQGMYFHPPLLTLT